MEELKMMRLKIYCDIVEFCINVYSSERSIKQKSVFFFIYSNSVHIEQQGNIDDRYECENR